MINEEVRTGDILKDLWVPLEDLQDGWNKSGEVGQEVYGAGIPFGVIARQHFQLKELKINGFLNYPLIKLRYGKKSVTFHVGGNGQFPAKLIMSGPKSQLSKIKVEVKNKLAFRPLTAETSGEFDFPGGSMVRISW
jgi:hypothetical protein